MVGSKQPTPVWLSKEEADAHCKAGASVWKFCSTDEGKNPDVVLVGIGTEVTFEVVSAAKLLRELLPTLRVRVVNVTDLMVLGPPGSHPHALTADGWDELFTRDKEIIVNYHGYSHDIGGLVFGRRGVERVVVHGYNEEGSTTTPFDMMVRNGVSRYHVAIRAVEKGAEKGQEADGVKRELEKRIMDVGEEIMRTGKDADDTYDVPEFN